MKNSHSRAIQIGTLGYNVTKIISFESKYVYFKKEISPLEKYWEDDNTGHPPTSILGGYIPPSPEIDTHGAGL